VADRRTPALLARVAEAAADPPPAWLPADPDMRCTHAVCFMNILELTAVHGGTPECLDLALPPLAVALGAAEPAIANAAARVVVGGLVSSAAKLFADGRYEFDPDISRAIVGWGLLPLLCDRVRDVARAGDAEKLHQTAYFAVCAIVYVLNCLPPLAGDAAAAGAVAAAAAALTCDASAAATAPALQMAGAQLVGVLLGPDGGLDRFGVPAGIDPDAIVCAPGVLQALASCSSTDSEAQGPANIAVARLWRTPDANRARRLFAAGLRPTKGPQTFEAWVAEEREMRE
jgi:hypothetical protein